MSHGPLSGIARISGSKSRRLSSYDRSGGNADFIDIAPGETATIADISGAGIITHLWMTIASPDQMIRRNLVIRMFWDGQEHASVESPIGDFFGQGWGLKYNFASMPLAAAPKNGNALVCYFPMPFSKGARIEIENQGPEAVRSFYFYVDFEEYTMISEENLGRFHASYRQELTTPESYPENDVEAEWEILAPYAKNPSDENNYVWCECEGEGHFVGVNMYIGNPGPIWYGEGDDMFLVDGEPWPGSVHGTGTEDYFNMSWCPDEHYQHPYFGAARVPGVENDSPRFGWIGRTHCYRFHLEDPIRFKKSLRASIEHGHANSLCLEIASVAYWYQTLPSKPLPPLPSPADRLPRPETRVQEIHRWRDEWRKSKGGGPLWGNEKA